MASHEQVIFVVHGIGDHSAKWSDSAMKVLGAWYKKFKLPGTFEERFKVIEILYGQPFIDYWKKHGEKAADLKKIKVPIKGFADAVLSLATNVPDGKLKSHVGDVYLYLGADYNELVALDVSIKIDKALVKLRNPIYSIIGHSLGK